MASILLVFFSNQRYNYKLVNKQACNYVHRRRVFMFTFFCLREIRSSVIIRFANSKDLGLGFKELSRISLLPTFIQGKWSGLIDIFTGHDMLYRFKNKVVNHNFKFISITKFSFYVHAYSNKYLVSKLHFAGTTRWKWFSYGCRGWATAIIYLGPTTAPNYSKVVLSLRKVPEKCQVSLVLWLNTLTVGEHVNVVVHCTVHLEIHPSLLHIQTITKAMQGWVSRAYNNRHKREKDISAINVFIFLSLTLVHGEMY